MANDNSIKTFGAAAKKLNEASYGGAFDIADDQYFTREELNEFADDVVDILNLGYSKFKYNSVYLELGTILELELEWDDYAEVIRQKIDMRKIRKPSDLSRVYAPVVASKAEKVFKEYGADFGPHLTENVEGQGVYSDKFYAYAKKLFFEDDIEGLDYLVKELIRYCKEEDLKDLWFDRIGKVADEGNDDDELMNEDLETPVLRGPEEGPEVGIASIVNNAIQDELKTIQMYNDAAVTARAEGYEDIASQIDEINTEENKHVGQLQELLKTISPNAQAIDAGGLEAESALTEQKKKPTFLERKWSALGQHGKVMYLTDSQLKELKDDHKDYEFTETTPYNTIPKDQKAYVAKKVVKEGIQPSDLAANVEDAFVKDELDLFVADALRDGSATEETLLTIANDSSNIEIDDMKRAINSFKESLDANNSTRVPYTSNSNNTLEEDVMGSRAEEIYNSFKNIEKELNGDGEAITSVIDKLYNDNREDPDYKVAYDKWASGQ